MAITDSGLGTFYGSSESYLSHLMTDFYSKYVNDAKNNAAVLLGLIPETSDRIAGKFIVEPVKYGRNVDAMNFVGDEGVLPDPGAANALSYAYRTRTMFSRVLISGNIIRASGMDLVRYVDVFDDVMEQMADDMAVELNRIMHNDGSGRIAEINDTATSATHDIRLNQSIESPATCTTPPNRFFYAGMRVAIYTNAGVHVQTTTVSSITDDDTIVFADSFTGVVGQWIVHVSNTSSTSRVDAAYRTEPMGIAGIFSDAGVLDGHGAASGQTGSDDFTSTSSSNFQGLGISNSFNQAIVLDGGGVLRDPTEELLQTAYSKAEKDNNAQIELLLSNYEERDRYGESLTPDKRYNNTTELTGGWTGLKFKDSVWVVDRHCYDNRIYGMALQSAGFKQHVETPLQPLDHRGEHWQRLQDADKYQAPWVLDFNVGVGVRQRVGFLLTDIAKTA